MDKPGSANLLSSNARATLERARLMPFSYGVRMYACPGPRRRLLVVLGEAHLKLGPAWQLGKETVGLFALRGVESFQRNQVIAGRLLGVLILWPRLALRALSFGLIKGSTITDAIELQGGTTLELEKTKTVPFALHVASIYLALLFAVIGTTLGLAFLQVIWPALTGGAIGLLTGCLTLLLLALEVHFIFLIPALILRRRSWSWMIHPAVGLIATRDMLMANGTVRMLEEHPEEATALVIMGRAHLPGFERELVDKHGFRRVELSECSDAADGVT